MSQSQFVSKCTVDSLQRAASSLLEGNLVAFPTETVYGLGADASNKQAVARIYEVKGRPADHPLIVHIHSMQVMGQWVDDVPEYAIALGRDFWPGPMTLIFKRSNLSHLVYLKLFIILEATELRHLVQIASVMFRQRLRPQ
jgi:L-threonylcarbamoyladenylate synthase